MSTLYIVDPGVMQDASTHATLKAGRAEFDSAASGARFYRSTVKGCLDEWIEQFGEWCEVDVICGSAPIKVWRIAKERKA
jgi:hypothetical protein